MVLAQGLPLEEAAQRIAIPKGTLANRANTAKRGTDSAAPPGSRSVAELEAEAAKLRKELAVEASARDVTRPQGRRPKLERVQGRRRRVGLAR